MILDALSAYYARRRRLKRLRRYAMETALIASASAAVSYLILLGVALCFPHCPSRIMSGIAGFCGASVGITLGCYIRKERL